MSTLLAIALAVSGTVSPSCSWDRPGANPFKGDVVAAVDRYLEIPESTRAVLKQRMARRAYDEIATIKRDSIEGTYRYADLRDMHFAQGRICRTVTRDRWSPQATERGLVYCHEGHCLIVPTVCRNVSRITRVPMTESEGAEAPGPEPALDIPFMAEGPPGGDGELQFEAPAAGPDPTFVGTASSDPSSPAMPFGLGDSARSGPLSGADPSFASSSIPLPAPSLPGLGVPSAVGPSSPPVPAPIPEPRSVFLWLSGLAVLAMAARRARRHSARS